MSAGKQFGAMMSNLHMSPVASYPANSLSRVSGYISVNEILNVHVRVHVQQFTEGYIVVIS